MKLSENTLGVLKNFSTINKSIYFKTGKILQTVSDNKEVLAKAEISDDIPSDFGIHDLNNFLGVVTLHKDSPELSIEDKNVVINGLGGRSKIKYRMAAKEVIVLPPEKAINMDDPEITLTLTSEDFDWIMKSANVLQSPNIAITSDSKEIYVQTYDAKNDASSVNTTSIGKNANESVYKMIFRTDKLKMIPGAYDVSIKVKGTGGVAHFKNKTSPIEYWITTETGSKYGE